MDAATARLHFLDYMNIKETEKAHRVMFYFITRGADAEWRRTISTFLFEKQFRGFCDSKYYFDWSLARYGLKLTATELKDYRDQVHLLYADRLTDFTEIVSSLRVFPQFQYHLTDDFGMLALISFLEIVPVGAILSCPYPSEGFPIVHANKTAVNLLCEPRAALIARRNILILPNMNAIDAAAEHSIARAIPCRNDSDVCFGEGEPTRSFVLFSKPLYNMDNNFQLILTVFSGDKSVHGVNLLASFLMSCSNHF